MVSDQKNLQNPTLSYGSFACRLEGFADPFSTMHELVEYLRTLSTSDAQTESTLPDLETLKTIVEADGQYQVTVHQQEDGTVVLSLKDDAASLIDTPSSGSLPDMTPIAASTLDQNSDDGMAEKLGRIRASVVQRNSVGFMDEPEVETEDEAMTDAHLLETADTDQPLSAALSTPLDEVEMESSVEKSISGNIEHAAEAVNADDDVTENQLEDEMAEHSTEEEWSEPDPEDDIAVSDPEGDVGERHAWDDMTGPHIEEDMADFQTGEVAGEVADDIHVEDSFAEPHAIEDTEAFHAEDEDLSLHTEDDHAEDDVAQPQTDDMIDDFHTEERAEEFHTGHDAIEFHAEETAEDTHFEDEVLEDALHSSAHKDYSAHPPEDSGALDDIASMLENIAASLTHPPAQDDGPTVTPTAQAEPDLMRELAEATEKTQDAKPSNDSDASDGVINLFDDSDASVVRLLNEADREMAKGENTRRRNSIQHLKAAADVFRGEKSDRDTSNSTEDGSEAYKEDLARVVHLTHDSADEENGRPLPPLMLVSEQRIDMSPLVLGTSSRATRPREVSLDGPDFEEEFHEVSREITSRFVKYAKHSGVTTLPGLLEAGTAFLTQIQNQPAASRSQITQLAAEALGRDVSDEEHLRALGELLREGKIIKVKRGHFILS